MKKLLLTMAMAMLLCAVLLFGANAQENTMDGLVYTIENGEVTITDWVYDGGWYYLDANGYMVTGTRTIQGINYTFKANGLLVE